MQNEHSRTKASSKKKSISMHEDVPVWADCCSCEAEPYWQALADEQNETENQPKRKKPHPG